MPINRVRLDLTNEDGIPGTDDAPDHVLARTYKGSMKGKPIRSASVCQFRRDENAPLRWLGTFVHMDNGGVRFVPGFKPRRGAVRQRRDGRTVREKTFRIKHITLDPDWETWHVTSIDGETRMGGAETHDLDDGRKLWCGLTVPGPDAFPPVHERTSVTVKVNDIPRSEVERRWKRFKDEALEEPDMPCTLHPDDRRPFGSSELLHVILVVGPPGSENYLDSGDPWLPPYHTPTVDGPADWETSPPPSRTHCS